MSAYILVVEDEEAISTMIGYNLGKEGYDVEIIDDGKAALTSISERKPDLIILDWMIPSLTGIEVCKSIRNNSDMRSIPVIMLTARGEEVDKLQGLDSGADDYMVKPFSVKELSSRIKAVLRRARPSLAGEKLEYEGIVVDIPAHKITYQGQPLAVGPTEYKLLCHFLERPGQVFSREQLLDSVWGQDISVESRTVDVHIRRLRKAMGDIESGLEDIIKTVRSAGYVLEK